VAGNYIGTDVTGSTALPNAAGVVMSRASGNTIGVGNVISGNSELGVGVVLGNRNVVAGNYIGTDATGSAALGNGSSGSVFITSGDANVIGGPAPGDRNVIAADGRSGVHVRAQSSGPVSNTVVENNYIGTDRTGTVDLGNPIGVEIGDDSAFGNTTTDTIVRANLVSGNGIGIAIGANSGAFRSHTTVVGNRIGTDANGTAALPNDSAGIAVLRNRDNIIGGPAPADRNLVSGNGGYGIQLDGAGNRQPHPRELRGCRRHRRGRPRQQQRRGLPRRRSDQYDQRQRHLGQRRRRHRPDEPGFSRIGRDRRTRKPHRH
jgi:titin